MSEIHMSDLIKKIESKTGVSIDDLSKEQSKEAIKEILKEEGINKVTTGIPYSDTN